MPPVSAERVRDRLQALAVAGLDVDTYSAAALEVLRRAVPFESACLATCDPDTSLLTGSTKIDLPDAKDAEFAALEYGVPDVNSYEEIARRAVPVGVLALDTDGHPERSTRYREFLVPHFDQGNELRAVLTSGGAAWGLLGLYRPTGPGGFSVAEADFVGGVSGVLAAGLRAGLVATAAAAPQAVTGPAVVVVDGDDAVISVSGAASARLAQLDGQPWGPLPIQLATVVAAARSFAAGRLRTPPTARVRTRSGQWLVVHASPLDSPTGSTGQIVVTLEEARPPEVVPLLVAALGLTPRESDVVRLVLAGCSTQDIGRQLHLSPYTVQDHLKSVFTKAGVSSRRELIATVFFDHYVPVLGTAPGPGGGLPIGS